MKATSSLSLLLFLQFTSALPLPTKELVLFDCRQNSCISLSKPNTPPTKLTEPHFPTHQLKTASQILSDIYDNSARTPTPHTPPTKALTSEHPLSSAFLLSLAKQASESEIETLKSAFSHSLAKHKQASESEITTLESALPAKPTSELPNLRKEDAQRYWESQAGSTEQSMVEVSAPSQAIKLCGHGRDQYLRIQGAYLAREYSDLIIVGIVVLFLSVVVALEACERCGDLQILYGSRKRRGEIYLEDSEEEAVYIVRKPIFLHPPSRNFPPRFQTQFRDGDKDKDTVVETEESGYDREAFEKV